MRIYLICLIVGAVVFSRFISDESVSLFYLIKTLRLCVLIISVGNALYYDIKLCLQSCKFSLHVLQLTKHLICSVNARTIGM